MSKKIFFSLMSVASALILFWNVYSFYSSPLIEFVVDRQVDDIKHRIERELLRSASQEHLTPKIRSALKPVPADWTSIDMLREFAEEHHVVLSPDLLEEIKLREDKERGMAGAYDDCVKCMMDSQSCRISTAQICDIALELTPVGDVRSINKAINDWQADRPVDRFDVSLATVGLAATAASVFTAGGAYSVKVGSGVIKAAKKTGSIGKPLWRFISDNTQGMIDFSRIPSGWHMRPASIGRALDAEKYEKLTSLAVDIGIVHGSVGTLKTLRIIKHIDNGKDAHRAKLVTEAIKDSVSKSFEVLGKNRLFKQTYRINPKITRIAGATIGFISSLIGLFWGVFLKLLGAVFGLAWGRLGRSWSNKK